MKKLHWTDSEFDRTHFLYLKNSSVCSKNYLALSFYGHSYIPACSGGHQFIVISFIGTKLLLNTNRKSYRFYRPLPLLVTLKTFNDNSDVSVGSQVYF